MKHDVREYYRIGKGKVFSCGDEPVSVKNKVTITFRHGHLLVKMAASVKPKSNEIVFCSECIFHLLI